MRELEQVFRRALVAYQTKVSEDDGHLVAPENAAFVLELPGTYCQSKGARLEGWRISLFEDGSAIEGIEGTTYDEMLAKFEAKVGERAYQVREMLK